MPDVSMQFSGVIVYIDDVFIHIVLTEISIPVISSIPWHVSPHRMKYFYSPAVNDPHVIINKSDSLPDKTFVDAIFVWLQFGPGS